MGMRMSLRPTADVMSELFSHTGLLGKSCGADRPSVALFQPIEIGELAMYRRKSVC